MSIYNNTIDCIYDLDFPCSQENLDILNAYGYNVTKLPDMRYNFSFNVNVNVGTPVIHDTPLNKYQKPINLEEFLKLMITCNWDEEVAKAYYANLDSE